MNATEVKTLRNKLNLTQAQFAQLLGVHAITVTRWETDPGHRPNDYQTGMMQQFDKAAEDKVLADSIRTVLITAGVIFAVYLLLNAVLGKKGG